jgi:hypothetical protein
MRSFSPRLILDSGRLFIKAADIYHRGHGGHGEKKIRQAER